MDSSQAQPDLTLHEPGLIQVIPSLAEIRLDAFDRILAMAIGVLLYRGPGPQVAQQVIPCPLHGDVRS